MKSCDDLLKIYEVQVECPGVSGFEHLDMLVIRSDLERNRTNLSPEQEARLIQADKRLWQQAGQFHDDIARIVSMVKWRTDENAPVTHWWWYLDVLAAIPASVTARESVPAESR